MAEERRLNASLDIRTTPESFQSLQDYLKEMNKIEKSAKTIRETMAGGGPGGSSTNPGSDSGPSIAVPGRTSGLSPSSGFTQPGGAVPWESHRTINEFKSKIEQVEQVTKRVRDNLATAGSSIVAPGGPSGGYLSGYVNPRLEQLRKDAATLGATGTGSVATAGGPLDPHLSGYANPLTEMMKRNAMLTGGTGAIATAGGAFDMGAGGHWTSLMRKGGSGPQSGFMDVAALTQQKSAMDMNLLTRASQDERYRVGGMLSRYHQSDSTMLPDDLQTMNKFGGLRRQWGQTLMGGAQAAAGNPYGAAGAMLRYGAAPLAGLTFAAGAASSYNTMGMVEAMGGNANDMARAGANSTWLGRRITGLSDDFTGRSQAIATQEYRNRFGQQDAETREQIRQSRNELERNRFEMDRANQVRQGDTRFASLGQFNLRTVEGERRSREAETMMPVERDRIERQRQLKIEQLSLADLEGQRGRLTAEQSANEAAMGKLNIRGDLKRGGAGFFEDVGKWNQLATRQQGIITELDQLQNRIEAKKGAVVQATGALAQSSVEELRARTQIAGVRRDVARGQADRIGGMNPFELFQSKQSFDAIQAAGSLDQFPDQIIQQAAAFDPDTIGKMRQNRGIQRIDAMGLVQNRVGAFQDSLPGAEEEYRRLNNAASEAGVKVGATAAKMLAEVLLSPDYLKAIEKGMRDQGLLNKGKIDAEVGAQNTKGN